MLAYVPKSRPAARAGSPRTLLFVVAGHVLLLALVLTARGEMPGGSEFIPTDIVFVPTPKPPPPPPPQPDQPRSDTRSRIDTPRIIVPVPRPDAEPLDRGPPLSDTTPIIGNAVDPLPLDLPTPAIVHKAARFVTAPGDIRPPYPASKQRLEEEATLRLALHIDERGRIISVAPVGAADPVFLDAARRHILKRWRYAPATEGGSAISSRIVVTLRFRLEE